jgi:hypothetical protein
VIANQEAFNVNPFIMMDNTRKVQDHFRSFHNMVKEMGDKVVAHMPFIRLMAKVVARSLITETGKIAVIPFRTGVSLMGMGEDSFSSIVVSCITTVAHPTKAKEGMCSLV